jgi:hypothetical protein
LFTLVLAAKFACGQAEEAAAYLPALRDAKPILRQAATI